VKTHHALLGALAWIGLSCGASGERTQLVYFPDMMETIPYDDYDPNPIAPNGQTLLLPPEGTVPVGGSPYFPYGESEEEAMRAGEELVNPIAASPESLERGKEVFDTMCIVCHGPAGEGDGPIIGRFPNPPSLLAERARSFPDGRIYHVITRGQGIMPSHAVQVRPDDRWKVIHYVRTLQPPPGETP
jgi:mono/diheme cytochrome c family protein